MNEDYLIDDYFPELSRQKWEEDEEVGNLNHSELREFLHKMIISTDLDDRQSAMLYEYYVEGKTFCEIGINYGISVTRVQQIFRLSMKKLRQPRFGVFEFEL